jgi:hypothetical protein
MGRAKAGHTKLKEALQIIDKEKGLTFKPTKGQRMLKTKFWNIVNTSFALEKTPSQMSNEEIGHIVESTSFVKYCQEPGFKDWFMNTNNMQQKLEYLFDLALDSVEEVLLSTDVKLGTAKVQILRVLAELGRKMPSKTEDKFADDDINRMSASELKKFLEKNGIEIKQETVVQLPTSDESEEVVSGDN